MTFPSESCQVLSACAVGGAIVLGEAKGLAEGVPGSEGMEEPAVDRSSCRTPRGRRGRRSRPRGRAEAVLQLPVAEVAAEESGEHHLRIVVGKIAGVGKACVGRAGLATGGRGCGAAVEKLVGPMLLSRPRAVAEEVGAAPERGHGGAKEVGSVLVARLHILVPEKGGEIVEGHRSVIRSQE